MLIIYRCTHTDDFLIVLLKCVQWFVTHVGKRQKLPQVIIKKITLALEITEKMFYKEHQVEENS